LRWRSTFFSYFDPLFPKQVFRQLGIPRGTSIESLTFGDLIAVTDAILANQQFLKDINARAHGEVTIRLVAEIMQIYASLLYSEAIRELELWGAQAQFTLVDYTDNRGAHIKVIKDWKDVLNQVGDNQALLQSLKDTPYYAQFADKAHRIFQNDRRCDLRISQCFAFILFNMTDTPFGIFPTGRTVGNATGRSGRIPARAESDPTQMGVPRADLRPWCTANGTGALPTCRCRVQSNFER
jgi:hypothetical protein